MPGRINEFQKTNKPDEFEIWVDFIEPDYFQDDFVIDNSFTINEASKILGKGKISKKFIVENCFVSAPTKEVIVKAGGTVKEMIKQEVKEVKEVKK